MTRPDAIQVWADWRELGGSRKMGTLHRSTVRGSEVLSFKYEDDWLATADAFQLDPQLQHVSGRQYPDSSGNFGLLMDSAPDRWGKMLIQRRSVLENGGGSVLFGTDYLLAVCDFTRMGGLRFTYGEDQPFLAEKTVYSVPPLHALRELEQASQSFEQASPDDPEYKKWLRLLLAPGTSLGGARPKGTVIDTEASLWIAKFPSRSDEYDVGAWESLVYELASKAGIDTVHSRAEKFSEQGHTFLIKRFDREGAHRIHFASAMTLLGHHDGDGEATGVSYLDLVDLIEHISENPNRDLEELWRRVVFNILVHNTDDHLRNHGFLLGAKGWKLSPVYDVNPQPWQGGLAINIDENHNECSLELAFSVAEYFRLSKKRAEQVGSDVKMAVKEWENKARIRGLNRDEIERMRAAFQ